MEKDEKDPLDQRMFIVLLLLPVGVENLTFY